MLLKTIKNQEASAKSPFTQIVTSEESTLNMDSIYYTRRVPQRSVKAEHRPPMPATVNLRYWLVLGMPGTHMEGSDRS
eukprot:6202944-Pleurochrysis_carterae.AAC.2